LAKTTPPTTKLRRSEYCLIASVADLDPRSVQGYYEGLKQPQPATQKVIRQALAELGLPDPHPPLTPRETIQRAMGLHTAGGE